MPINFGIIGYGYTGRQHARALAQLDAVRLVGVAEVDAQKRGQAKVRTTVEDYRALLEDPAIEAVSVCLPHILHEEVTLAVLEAGKHALVEKPLAISVEAGERICHQARKSSRVLMVEMTHRFLPPLVEARRLVQQGEIGEIMAIDDIVIESVGQLGSLPQWMMRLDIAGGGVGLTSGIHLMDHVAWLASQAVALDSARFGYSRKLGDVEDTASFALHLENGAPVHILLCWRTEVSSFEGCVTIYGEKGTLRVEPWRGWKLESTGGIRQKIYFEDHMPIAERALAGMKGALAEFAEAIQQGRPPNPSPEESLSSQRIIEEAYQRSRNVFVNEPRCDLGLSRLGKGETR
jgi:predicted dehydrogenase